MPLTLPMELPIHRFGRLLCFSSLSNITTAQRRPQQKKEDAAKRSTNSAKDAKSELGLEIEGVATQAPTTHAKVRNVVPAKKTNNYFGYQVLLTILLSDITVRSLINTHIYILVRMFMFYISLYTHVRHRACRHARRAVFQQM